MNTVKHQNHMNAFLGCFLVTSLLTCPMIVASPPVAVKASTVLMVPPEGFRYNPETAISNAYQHASSSQNSRSTVMNEFNQMVDKMTENGIKVILLNQDKSLPDAVFPNNWFSTHVDDNNQLTVIVYPMLTKNRQAEVNISGLKAALATQHIRVKHVIDLRKTTHEVLEGTGSMILDRPNHVVYASLSPRTDADLVSTVSHHLGYTPVLFHSQNQKSQPIYHTNVMMGLAQQYAVICLQCIQDLKERRMVMKSLDRTHKKIIDINQDQVNHMCGNVLELENAKGQSMLVMSEQAYRHFTPSQLRLIRRYSKPLPVAINQIEEIGGGSARCMIAEIYEPLRA